MGTATFTPTAKTGYPQSMTHGIIIRLVLALLLIALGGFVALMNWVMVIQSHRTGRLHSPVPLVGALVLGAGLALLAPTRHYAWAAILADYGTLALLVALPMLVREVWKTRRFNLAAEYRGERGTLSARVRLYRSGVCVIRYDLRRTPGEVGMTGTGRVGTWSQDGQRLVVRVGEEAAEFEVAEGQGEVLRQVRGFSGDADELSLVGVDLRRTGE